MTESISASFDYPLKYAAVRGSRMAYIDEGQGDAILFLHGNPTSSYLWRNIIPHVSALGRCIAPDLIGMGRSDKPDLEYSFADHAEYLDGFIRALGLRDITLVVHDWGSALGFDWAMRHEAEIRGIAFMEPILAPVESWEQFPETPREMFRAMRTPGVGEKLVLEDNIFIEQLLPGAVVRGLTEAERAHYRAPFPDAASRKPVLAWPRQIPIAGEPREVVEIVTRSRDALVRSRVPKLLFTSTPGGLMSPALIAWCRAHLPALEVLDVGAGIHYLQEDQPHAIGRGLADWISRLPVR